MAEILDSILFLFLIAIFIRSILTWFPVSPNNPLQILVIQITEPILGPMRKYLPRLGYIDLTPMIAIIVVIVIRNIIASNL